MWVGPESIRLEKLRQRYHPAAVLAVFGFLSGGLSIALLALMAHFAHSPLVFPSLGPTAFLLFYHPLEPVASPRNTILGHLVGAVAGWVSLLIFGLAGVAPDGLDQISWARLGAAAVSIGATIALMELWDVPHPPAGATTLIVSLGLMDRGSQIGVLLLAVVALVALGWAINRFVGLPCPIWRSPKAPRQFPH
jgi:CBS-domain-containing membrane protein